MSNSFQMNDINRFYFYITIVTILYLYFSLYEWMCRYFYLVSQHLFAFESNTVIRTLLVFVNCLKEQMLFIGIEKYLFLVH